jgi:hypothetical protein
MKSARLATMLLALSLLTSAATAHAECAWVLWQNRGTVDAGRHLVSNWEPGKAFETAKACADRQRDEEFAATRAQPKEPWLFRCLPDTVDPRGVKGK